VPAKNAPATIAPTTTRAKIATASAIPRSSRKILRIQSPFKCFGGQPPPTCTNLHQPPPTAVQNRRLLRNDTLVLTLSTIGRNGACPPLRTGAAVRART